MLFRVPSVSGKVDTLFPAAGELLEDFEESKRLFGDSITDVIVVSVEKPLDTPQQSLLLDLEEELSEIEGISAVVSPLADIAKDSSPISLYRPDQGAARFLIKIRAELSKTQRRELNSSVEDVLTGYRGLKPSRTGPAFISDAVTSVVEAETSKRVPITVTILFLVCLLLLRSARIAILALLPPLLSVQFVVCLLALLGKSLGPISQLSPPFLLAVVASYSVHVLVRIRNGEVGDKSIVSELRSAVGIAATTTVIGLLSLLSMDVSGVREFALITSLGVGWGALCSLYVLPRFSKVIVSSRRLSNARVGPLVFRFSRNRTLVALTLLVSGLLALGASRLTVHTDPLDFIPDSAEQRLQIDSATERFPGNRMLSLYFFKEGPSGRQALALRDFQQISELAQQLELVPQVRSTVCDGDFQTSHRIRTDFSLRNNVPGSYGPADITAEQGMASRILIEHGLEGAELIQFAEEIEGRVEEFQGLADLQWRVTSLELVLAQQSQKVVNGIFRSVFFTLLLVAALLMILFRSFIIVVIGLVPNVIPIAVVFGSIGWFYGDINIGASLVAAAAISIAVDNTFHLLLSWRARLRSGFALVGEESVESKAVYQVDPQQTACRASLADCFPAFWSGTVLLVSGFGAMAVSDVLPIQQFGFLLSLSLLVGLLADSIVLPYLLLGYEVASRRSSSRSSEGQKMDGD
jgi:hypothetical protein